MRNDICSSRPKMGYEYFPHTTTDIANSGIWLSYRPASLCSMRAGTTTLCESRLHIPTVPIQGLRIWLPISVSIYGWGTISNKERKALGTMKVRTCL